LSYAPISRDHLSVKHPPPLGPWRGRVTRA